ncbi:MAG: primase-like DNA-binding domain-containing protein, partial [Proteobacteria bacterium]|nr:primase-like DNA-binding domain-containing protein [Pseudomonadota bacterium]
AATMCVADPDAITSASTLYTVFRRFVEDNGFRDMKSTTFWQRMNQLGHKSIHGRTGNVYNIRVIHPDALPFALPNPYLPSTRLRTQDLTILGAR